MVISSSPSVVGGRHRWRSAAPPRSPPPRRGDRPARAPRQRSANPRRAPPCTRRAPPRTAPRRGAGSPAAGSRRERHGRRRVAGAPRRAPARPRCRPRSCRGAPRETPEAFSGAPCRLIASASATLAGSIAGAAISSPSPSDLDGQLLLVRRRRRQDRPRSSVISTTSSSSRRAGAPAGGGRNLRRGASTFGAGVRACRCSRRRVAAASPGLSSRYFSIAPAALRTSFSSRTPRRA